MLFKFMVKFINKFLNNFKYMWNFFVLFLGDLLE